MPSRLLWRRPLFSLNALSLHLSALLVTSSVQSTTSFKTLGSLRMTSADSGKVVFGSDDALFGCIERSQRGSGRPFGTFLDSGTGTHSLRWIASLVKNEGIDPSDPMYVSSFCAVTADENMRRNVQSTVETLAIEDKGEVVIGNWAEGYNGKDSLGDGEIIEGRYLCKGDMFDTILCDYLVGAMDGFSPYYQDRIFSRLVSHLKPGGRIYIVGLNPIPDKVSGPANIFCKVTKMRDSCILLAGNRCYREYPPDWIERHLELAGLNVLSQSKFPIMYSHRTIVRQLNVARSKLKLFPSKRLAEEMGKVIDDLEKESKEATDLSPTGRLKLGFDYVIAAEMPHAEKLDS